MDKEYVMRVAATIREQLVTMTDTPVLMSWGIGEFMATVFNDLPGLKFHVNGRLFQGEVLICLNGSDYYEVYLRNGTDIECLSDEVCFDELGELIDRHIESGTDKEEYARFCEQAAMSCWRASCLISNNTSTVCRFERFSLTHHKSEHYLIYRISLSMRFQLPHRLQSHDGIRAIP